VSELQGIVRFSFHDGDVDEFKRLSARCMEIVRTPNTGTLQDDTYLNDDQTECVVLERYRDSLRSSSTPSTSATSWRRSSRRVPSQVSCSGSPRRAPAKRAGSPVGLLTLYESL